MFVQKAQYVTNTIMIGKNNIGKWLSDQPQSFPFPGWEASRTTKIELLWNIPLGSLTTASIVSTLASRWVIGVTHLYPHLLGNPYPRGESYKLKTLSNETKEACCAKENHLFLMSSNPFKWTTYKRNRERSSMLLYRVSVLSYFFWGGEWCDG